MVLISVGVRDDVVIATKYTANVHDQQVEKYPNQINRSGNSVKSMMVSLEASLKKLGTTYIDVFCECSTIKRTNADDGRHALVGLDYSH
jgi:aryl-alcohol dehydrogenase-like predicted oxidoreductase